jgi:hypothetical protein
MFELGHFASVVVDVHCDMLFQSLGPGNRLKIPAWLTTAAC